MDNSTETVPFKRIIHSYLCFEYLKKEEIVSAADEKGVLLIGGIICTEILS